jgi:hypothetical protein
MWSRSFEKCTKYVCLTSDNATFDVCKKYVIICGQYLLNITSKLYGSVLLELLGSFVVKISQAQKISFLSRFCGQPASTIPSRFVEATRPQLSTTSRAPTETVQRYAPIPLPNYVQMPPSRPTPDQNVFPIDRHTRALGFLPTLPPPPSPPPATPAAARHLRPPNLSQHPPRSVPWRKDRPRRFRAPRQPDRAERPAL